MEFNTENPNNEYAADAVDIRYVKLAVLMFWHHEGLIDWQDPKYQKFYDSDIFLDDELYKAAMNPRHMLAIKRLQTRYRTERDARQEQSAAAKRKKKSKKKKSKKRSVKLSSEMLTLYYNGLEVYSSQHSGKVSVAVTDWWELVCYLNPTFWIPRFQNDTENLYDIIRTWPQDDATFRRWKNTLERRIKKTKNPLERASCLNGLL